MDQSHVDKLTLDGQMKVLDGYGPVLVASGTVTAGEVAMYTKFKKVQLHACEVGFSEWVAKNPNVSPQVHKVARKYWTHKTLLKWLLIG